MRKLVLLLVALSILAVGGLVLPTSAAQAQPPEVPAPAGNLDAGELLRVFPEAPDDLAELSRGAFAALLVEAAQVPPVAEQVALPADVDADAWYAAGVATLYQNGILRGYPDGTVGAGNPVTRQEAVALVSRVLGLPEGAAAAGEVPGLAESSWAYVPYSWLFTWGLVSGDDPAAKMTVGEAAKFLAQVFGSDPEAEAIIEKAYQVQQEIKGLSFTGDMALTMRPRAGLPDMPPGLKEIKMTGNITSEIILPATLHQSMKMELGLPSELLGPEAPSVPPLEMEQYLVDGVMYQKMPDPTTGEVKWVRVPEEAMPDMEALMQEIWENEFYQQAVPEELRPYLHYRLLGTTELNGRQVYKIVSYGRIDDLAAFMQAALPENMQEMLLDPQSQEGLGNINDLIQMMSFWSVSYVGVDDYLTYGEEFQAVVGFGEEVMGEAFPIDVMEMQMSAHDYRYGDDIVVELPPEALEAEELPLLPEEPGPESPLPPAIR